VHPPPSPAWANFTLMMECTPESSRCYSVYSVLGWFVRLVVPVQEIFFFFFLWHVYFSYFYNIHTYIHTITFIRRHSLRPLSIFVLP
jgi:hypothetical protein